MISAEFYNSQQGLQILTKVSEPSVWVMVRAVTEPHPLWERVHAPKIKLEEALELEKLFGKVPMSFVMYSLGW